MRPDSPGRISLPRWGVHERNPRLTAQIRWDKRKRAKPAGLPYLRFIRMALEEAVRK